jgi:hypothetical protein
MEGTMHASQRYRDSAAECLLAAQEASQPHCRKLHLSMAISWLSLARKYEAIEHLFQETGEAAVICHQAALDQVQLTGSRLLLETPNHRKPLEARNWLITTVQAQASPSFVA